MRDLFLLISNITKKGSLKMNFFKKIIKKFRKEEVVQKKLNDVADTLAIKFGDEISCVGGEKFKKWREDAKKEPSLNAIFEISEFDKQLKKITNRKEVILFLEERKKYEEKRNIETFGSQFLSRIKKEKYNKTDLKYLKAFLDSCKIKSPNLEELTLKEKQLFIDKVSKKIELDAEYYAKSSFKHNLQTWELTH